MKKIFGFLFFSFTLFFLLSANSYARINYKTDLLNFVWSQNCNSKTTSFLYTENPNGEIKRNAFFQGQPYDDLNQTITKIESAGGSILKLYFVDSRNNSGIDQINLQGESYKSEIRYLNGKLVVSLGIDLRTNEKTPVINRCPANSEAYIMVSNLYSNKNPSNQTNTEVDKGASSWKKACLGPDDNYKKIQYPDGSTARAKEGIIGRDNCGCRLELGSISYVLDSAYLNNTNQMSPEISKIYKAYAPFYGCPDNADYSKIAQILKAKEDQEAKAKAEEKNANDEKIRNAIKYLVDSNQKFCKGTPSTRLSFLEYLGSNFRTHPDDIKLKRVEPSEEYLGCIAVFYSSRGPITCQVVFDEKGVISDIEELDSAAFRIVRRGGSILDASKERGCK